MNILIQQTKKCMKYIARKQKKEAKEEIKAKIQKNLK